MIKKKRNKMKLTKKSEVIACGAILLIYAGVIATSFIAGKAIGNLLEKIGKMGPIHFTNKI